MPKVMNNGANISYNIKGALLLMGIEALCLNTGTFQVPNIISEL